ncbi:MAG: hypothetical protein ABH851_07000 [Methanobacteriota archaeon]
MMSKLNLRIEALLAVVLFSFVILHTWFSYTAYVNCTMGEECDKTELIFAPLFTVLYIVSLYGVIKRRLWGPILTLVLGCVRMLLLGFTGILIYLEVPTLKILVIVFEQILQPMLLVILAYLDYVNLSKNN